MIFKIGSNDEIVKQIQKIVGVTEDGVFGMNTQAAVKTWQSDHNLKPDGIVGNQSLSKMGIKVNESAGDSNPHKRASVAWYEFLYKSLRFDRGTESEILRNSKTLLKGKPRYEALTRSTGVPWTTIAGLHMMEGACDFRTYLGNGQSLQRRTTIVPKGRGPFETFEAGAIDALRLDGLTSVKDWTLGLELKYAEQFNGTGYLRYHPSEFSPYIWACSSINDGTGKYTSDGHYDPNANANAQVGVATMFKQLEMLGEYAPVFLS